RLLQFRLEEEVGDGWWLHPPWNPGKARPSVLDVERLLRQHRGGMQRCLAAWLETEGKAGEGGPREGAMGEAAQPLMGGKPCEPRRPEHPRQPAPLPVCLPGNSGVNPCF